MTGFSEFASAITNFQSQLKKEKFTRDIHYSSIDVDQSQPISPQIESRLIRIIQRTQKKNH